MVRSRNERDALLVRSCWLDESSRVQLAIAIVLLLWLPWSALLASLSGLRLGVPIATDVELLCVDGWVDITPCFSSPLALPYRGCRNVHLVTDSASHERELSVRREDDVSGITADHARPKPTRVFLMVIGDGIAA
ncbi:hypothetical protein CFD26_105570 [Aspergillus turcosus]|uniref:Uncharacterized protein n=1 Tax=Aspergillus turcosus TaxID=1245748 RepID=A0A3R7HTV0_9EURO|nr:hypothetical protein CFD26_105570 [Aspergillus turcosus]